jgi:hypothetical protein
MFMGIVGYWALVDFPDKAHTSWHFLNEREAKFIIERVNKDRGDARPEPFNWKKFLRGGADIKIWGFAMVSSDDDSTGTGTYNHRSSSTQLPSHTPSHTSCRSFSQRTWASQLARRSASLLHRTRSLRSSCIRQAGLVTSTIFADRSFVST